MDKNDYKLCYIEENKNKAYFTNNFKEQWGDDWNDKPYEHNAGNPYDTYWDDDVIRPIDLVAVYFELPNYYSYLPCDNFVNSPYSVDDINKKAVAWIHTEDFNILAETTLKDFKKIIKGHGGIIYVKED